MKRHVIKLGVIGLTVLGLVAVPCQSLVPIVFVMFLVQNLLISYGYALTLSGKKTAAERQLEAKDTTIEAQRQKINRLRKRLIPYEKEQADKELANEHARSKAVSTPALKG